MSEAKDTTRESGSEKDNPDKTAVASSPEMDEEFEDFREIEAPAGAASLEEQPAGGTADESPEAEKKPEEAQVDWMAKAKRAEERRKGHESEALRLKTEVEELRRQLAQQRPVEPAPTPSAQRRVEELEAEIAAAYEDVDSAKAAKLTTQLIELKTQQAIEAGVRATQVANTRASVFARLEDDIGAERLNDPVFRARAEAEWRKGQLWNIPDGMGEILAYYRAAGVPPTGKAAQVDEGHRERGPDFPRGEPRARKATDVPISEGAKRDAARWGFDAQTEKRLQAKVNQLVKEGKVR